MQPPILSLLVKQPAVRMSSTGARTEAEQLKTTTSPPTAHRIRASTFLCWLSCTRTAMATTSHLAQLDSRALLPILVKVNSVKRWLRLSPLARLPASRSFSLLVVPLARTVCNQTLRQLLLASIYGIRTATRAILVFNGLSGATSLMVSTLISRPTLATSTTRQ